VHSASASVHVYTGNIPVTPTQKMAKKAKKNLKFKKAIGCQQQ
jgi:hypothetical protein